MFIVEKKPKAVASENYRTLRTNIQYSSFDESNKVIVITSSEPGEGKTTTAGNLALALAQDENKVLLIDCDLRKPSLHKKFKLSNVKGLTEVLIGKETLKTILVKHNKNLDILTSGKIPPNPSEMLSSKTMDRLLDELKTVYDYIMLDTPPIHAVTDSQILAAKADGTIVVVRAERIKKDSAVDAIKRLKKVNANILGTVLNGVDTSKNKCDYCYCYGEKKE